MLIEDGRYGHYMNLALLEQGMQVSSEDKDFSIYANLGETVRRDSIQLVFSSPIFYIVGREGS